MDVEPMRQRGQASVEFVVIASSLVAALCLPWADGLSPAAWLLGVFVDAAAAMPMWLAAL